MSSYVSRPDCSETRYDNRLRTALIDSVTHEFRSPLTSIKAAVEALLAHPRLGPSQHKELLSIINEEADRLITLVTSAVETTRRLGAQVNLNLESQTVASIVNAAEADYRSLLGSHSISVQLETGLPAVRADLERAKKALLQLLENAAKYSPSDEPITITAGLSGKFVTISVIDHGDGIEGSEQRLIFKRFYRGKNHREVVQGTGMGLPIANAIIKAHGGSLTVASQYGHGSKFSFTLPVYTRGPFGERRKTL